MLKGLHDSIKLERARRKLQGITEANKAYSTSIDRVVEQRRAANTEQARDLLMGEARHTREKLAATLNALIDSQREMMQSAAKAADNMVEFASIAVIVLAVAAIILSACSR